MLPQPAPEVVIHMDGGGLLDQYQWAAWKLGYFGSRVKINGVCASACTAILMLPAERLCVTHRAEFWFHEARRIEPGTTLSGRRSEEGTARVYHWYPPPIRKFIDRHGGLAREWIKLRGVELRRLFRSCR